LNITEKSDRGRIGRTVSQGQVAVREGFDIESDRAAARPVTRPVCHGLGQGAGVTVAGEKGDGDGCGHGGDVAMMPA